MKVLIIIQARMTSTRLPGKVLKQVLSIPLLEYLIKRLKRIKQADSICIACTTNEADQPIVELGQQLGVEIYRGSESDVLARHYEAANKLRAEHIMRITSDCPLIDPHEMDLLLSAYLTAKPEIDYMSSGLFERSYPRGMEAEVFSYRALEIAFNKAVLPYEREHVTPYIYTHPDVFNLKGFTFKDINGAKNESHHRWTVDTSEDFELISRILTKLYPTNPDFTISDILELMRQHPEWVSINAHVHQKHFTE